MADNPATLLRSFQNIVHDINPRGSQLFCTFTSLTWIAYSFEPWCTLTRLDPVLLEEERFQKLTDRMLIFVIFGIPDSLEFPSFLSTDKVYKRKDHISKHKGLPYKRRGGKGIKLTKAKKWAHEMDRKEKWLEKGQKKNIWKIIKSWRVGKVLCAETEIIRESFENGGV